MSCRIAVRVTPRSSKPGIGAWRPGVGGREELEVRVAEAPSDGAANQAVERLLAGALDVSQSEVTIVSGRSSRHKRVELPMPLDQVKQRLGE